MGGDFARLGDRGWRATTGESFPTPQDENDLVMFVDFIRRGLGIPVHPFLRKLLRYYKIRLIHLHPNSILHLLLIFTKLSLEFCPISICSATSSAFVLLLDLGRPKWSAVCISA